MENMQTSEVKENYGQELILDLHGCNISTFTRESIKDYCEQLCEVIDMEAHDLHFWDDEDTPEDECQTNPKTCGISAVQFILTSSIVIHTLTKLRTAYINIFSCKDFEDNVARTFTENWFRSENCCSTSIVRK